MKGTYRKEDGTGCLLCHPGFYQEQIGAVNISQCLPCQKGRFSDALGLNDAIGCQKCPFGKASNTLNATSSSTCIPCPLNEFAENQGQVTCDVCSTGKATRTAGSISCERCRPGEFMLIKIMECLFVKNVTVENIVMVQLSNAMTVQLVAIIIVITLAAPHARLESGPIQ
jgi:hypothetical protein